MTTPAAEPQLPKEFQKLIKDYEKAHATWMRKGTAGEQYVKKMYESMAKLLAAAQTVHLLWGLNVSVDVQGTKIEFKQDKPKGTYVD